MSNLSPETKVVLRANALIVGIISIVSFTIGSATFYYSQQAEIKELRSRIERIDEYGTRDTKRIQEDVVLVKNDVRWLVRQWEEWKYPQRKGTNGAD